MASTYLTNTFSSPTSNKNGQLVCGLKDVILERPTISEVDENTSVSNNVTYLNFRDRPTRFFRPNGQVLMIVFRY